MRTAELGPPQRYPPAPAVGEPPRHPGAGGASPTFMLTRALAPDHTHTATDRGHGGPHNGVAPRPARPLILGVGVPSAACTTVDCARPTARTMDRAPYNGTSALHVPNPVPNPQVPRASNGGILALRAHCALLLDYVPHEEPLGTPLGNTLRIRRPKLDWRGP